MKCKIHPKYKGLRKPRVKSNSKNIISCSCWGVYYDRNSQSMISNPLTGQKNWITHEEWIKRGHEAGKRLARWAKEELDSN